MGVQSVTSGVKPPSAGKRVFNAPIRPRFPQASRLPSGRLAVRAEPSNPQDFQVFRETIALVARLKQEAGADLPPHLMAALEQDAQVLQAWTEAQEGRQLKSRMAALETSMRKLRLSHAHQAALREARQRAEADLSQENLERFSQTARNILSERQGRFQGVLAVAFDTVKQALGIAGPLTQKYMRAATGPQPLEDAILAMLDSLPVYGKLGLESGKRLKTVWSSSSSHPSGDAAPQALPETPTTEPATETVASDAADDAGIV